MESISSTSAEFFDAIYAGADDPWKFASSVEERTRYATVVTALGDRRFESAFEPGCSIGELTAQLALRCDRLLATDISVLAADRARRRCASLPQVEVRHEALTLASVRATTDVFDLIVFCEVGYYFAEHELARVVDGLTAEMQPGGLFVATHWTGHSDDHVLPGDQVHHIVRSCGSLTSIDDERYDNFLFGSWRRT
ncbi:MAG TPA: SAM-dependent methyltransferase [Ilumatobacteraceae bacterium]